MYRRAGVGGTVSDIPVRLMTPKHVQKPISRLSERLLNALACLRWFSNVAHVYMPCSSKALHPSRDLTVSLFVECCLVSAQIHVP